MTNINQEEKAQGAALQAEQRAGKNLKKRLLWIGLAFGIFFLDQLSKWAVTEIIFRPRIEGKNGLNFFEWYINTPNALSGIYIKITSFFNLVMAWNTGVSFSMFSNSGDYMKYILIAVALGITALFSTWLWRTQKHREGICYALIIGGALGNVIDRVRFGAVIDFLDFHIMGYHWPAFNVADMAVVIGVTLLVITSLFFDLECKERYRKQRKN